jgi:radical SAM protein with 4Fe4S-binding SPASM domain
MTVLTPEIVIWEITLKCNLNCLHCGSSAGYSRENELSEKEAIKVCEELAEIGTKGVALMGGEIFLRKDWYEISKKIKDLDMALSIVTNGYVNPNNFIDKMIKLEVDSLSVGLDGLKKTHNLIRGKDDAFDKTINFIDETKKAELDPCPITTFHKLNFEEFHEIKELVLGKGLDWHILTGILIGRFPKDQLLTKEEHYELGLLIADAQKKYSANKVIPGHIHGFHSEGIPDITPYQEWNGCYAGKKVLGIRSNGDVLGCETLPDKFIEGNVRKKSLKDIWNDPKAFSYNRNFKISDLNGFCKNCKHGRTCKGGCMTRSYSMTNQAHNDPYCYYRIEQER